MVKIIIFYPPPLGLALRPPSEEILDRYSDS